MSRLSIDPGPERAWCRRPVPTRGRPLIVHVTTVPWSLWSFFRGQFAYMRRYGLDAVAVCSGGDLVQDIAQREGVEVYTVPMTRRVTPVQDLVSLVRLTRLLRRLQPTIVHTHTAKAGLLGLLAGVLAGVPIRLYTLHGWMGPVGRLLRWVEGPRMKLCLRLAHAVPCSSHSLKRKVVEAGLCPADKIRVAGYGSVNGIDAQNDFNPDRLPAGTRRRVRQEYGIPLDATAMVYVGRLMRSKGVNELAEAWARLRARFPNLYLVIVGVAEAHDPASPARIEVLKADPRVHFTGFVKDMPAIYAAADLLVLPTYSEGLPYTLLEAGAMGLPSVATRVTGCVDVIEDGFNGVLVEPYSAESLRAGLARLLGDPEARREMGRRARQRVLERFRPEVVWRELLAMYRRLLAQRCPEVKLPDADPAD